MINGYQPEAGPRDPVPVQGVADPDPFLEVARQAAAMIEKLMAIPRHLVSPLVERGHLLTLEEAAEHLAVGRTTIQELVDSGELAVVEVTGRAVRVDPRDLEEFKRRRRVRRG